VETMKLVNMKPITGRIILRTGLHIGAGDMEMHIGGTDNPVIKHPHTNEPYIPGSSLKGKVRSLLEMKSGLMIKTKGKPVNGKLWKNLQESEGKDAVEAEKILKLFGISGSDEEAAAALGPTRASFSDCHLSETWRDKVRIKRWPLTEVKAENSIDRIKGTAEHPRFMERVPAGIEFDFSISLKNFDQDENSALLDYLLVGLKLLELDALGGSGSRGYGRIEFEFDDKNLKEKFDNIKPFVS
jgi:CRISPR-associated protein Csm3